MIRMAEGETEKGEGNNAPSPFSVAAWFHHKVFPPEEADHNGV